MNAEIFFDSAPPTSISIERSISGHQNVVNELRGGGRLEDTAWIIYFIWLSNFQYRNVEGFQPIRPPHQEWMPGSNSRPPYPEANRKVGGRITVRSDATNQTEDAHGEARSHKVRKYYSRELPTLYVENQDERITPWETAKKAYHGPDFGIQPTDYGMTQADLNNISNIGLINHLNQGGNPPTLEYVAKLQNRWKAFSENPNVVRDDKGTFMGKKAIIYKDPLTNQVVIFNPKIKTIISGYKLKEAQSIRYNKTGEIGKSKK